jgi:hypothetical protein
MSSIANVTGHWVGSYMQGGSERPISADLVQDGATLSGSMRDGQPDRECSLFEGAVEAGLPPGADELIDANLRKMVPDAGTEPIRWVSQLPEESVLEGLRDRDVVSFTKTYKGTSFSGYKVGDKFVGMEAAGHAVQYEGQLSPDGKEIEGRWWIDADPEMGTRRAHGHFILRREADVS